MSSPATVSEPGRVGGVARTLGAARDYGIVGCFVVLFTALAISSDSFLTRGNLENILSQQSPTLIVAAAGTLVLVAGGFDLSVGALAALAGIVAAKAAGAVDPVFAILAGTVAGGVLGLANGLVATALRVNPLVGTLATSFVIRGLGVVMTGGLLVSVREPSFATLGQGKVSGVPIAVLIMFALVGALAYALARSTYGRRLYAVGGNPEAARLAGIRVDLVRASTFVISGLAAGIAGAMLASRVSTAQADTAAGLEFTVLAAIVVGGTSIQGGEGAVWRTVVGVLFIALIDNGFTQLGLDPIYKQIVQGTIILVAVAADAWSRRA